MTRCYYDDCACNGLCHDCGTQPQGEFSDHPVYCRRCNDKSGNGGWTFTCDMEKLATLVGSLEAARIRNETMV